MKIERLITVFDNNTEELKGEINIDYVDVEELKKIFRPFEDDFMYKIYEIKSDHVQMVNTLLKVKIVFDLSANTYYVECVQLDHL